MIGYKYEKANEVIHSFLRMRVPFPCRLNGSYFQWQLGLWSFIKIQNDGKYTYILIRQKKNWDLSINLQPKTRFTVLIK